MVFFCAPAPLRGIFQAKTHGRNVIPVENNLYFYPKLFPCNPHNRISVYNAGSAY